MKNILLNSFNIILVVKFDYKLNDDLMLLIESFIITIVGYIEYYIVVLMWWLRGLLEKFV